MIGKPAKLSCARALLVFVVMLGLCSANSAIAFADEPGDAASSPIVPAAPSTVAPLSPDGARGAIPETTPAKSVHDANGLNRGLHVNSALPARYSSLDAGLVTPMRNQGQFGTCWAFSTLAAIESSLLAHGQEADAQSLDLSERHLAYFTYHAATDPLGNTVGDKTTAVGSTYGAAMSDPYLSTGGNNYLAAMTLAMWQGAAGEDSAPYDDLLDAYIEDDFAGSDQFLADTALDASDAYAHDLYHLEDMYRIALADRADVKQAIVDYGAAAVLINSQYITYSEEHAVLFNHATTNTDHGVTLVGWDDDFNREAFGGYDGVLPERNGAWLVKNSWGSWFGEGGYFWISYEDLCLNSSSSKAYVFDMAEAGKFDNNYQYDGSTGDYYNYLPSGGSIANVFKVAGNKAKQGAERLDAVSIALDDVNVGYSVQVYLNPKSAADPTSGTPALATPVSGKTSYDGYYTIDLPKPVYLVEGDTFAVVITLSHANGSRVNYSVDASGSWNWGVSFKSNVSAGQSFERSSSDSSWHDLASSTRLLYGNEVQCAARVKAFTRNISTSELPVASLSKNDVSLAVKSYTYDGSAKKPAVKVVHAGRTLAAGADYTVEYRNNKNAGTASAVVSGKGKYSGTVACSFSIAKAKINMSGISLKGKTFTYNGQKRSLAIGGKLPSGAKVSYSGNGKRTAGAYTVKATFASTDSNRYIAKADAVKTATLRIKQGKQSLSVSKAQLAKSVSSKKLKTVACTTSKVTVKGVKTKLTYKKVGGSARLSIGKATGKVKVAKGTKRGTLRIKVKATAANDKKTYAAATKIFTVIVRVK